ncbi:MAG: N-acetyltransferase [Rhodospirillaceae bacterium]|jgi:putative acetyltransferase|nr:N-acetyltransferase [Rhodospirillaceae bacterium]MBT3883233.1 N-acetyltransferase [Rhodospirillaceae bacterium]MBT4115167.1 N-acetyltransferase [Rhodospirillaceae bacterium]MBT4674610.1 N-acetyltransferase [Rhodospirillaceae bacterium]MBT4718826.1 N-acetyltransferase [Rhodospirillaceae bacterium]
MALVFREAADTDIDDVFDIERRAFGRDNEAQLVAELLGDPGADPKLSLLTLLDGKPAGHILFTSVRLIGAKKPVSAQILAPLAVVPEAQDQGIGSKLIEEGLRLIGLARTDLVFVLGDPGYYPRFGFEPAGRLGLNAPYPIPDKHAEAWMVQALSDHVIGSVAGRVRCADALNKVALWRE